MAVNNHRRAVPLSDADAARLKPSTKLGRVTARASGAGTATLLLYGEIGYDVTFPGVMQALASIGDVASLDIRICSVGGYTSDGWAIYNALARHSAKKIITVEGMAASMASIIAMVGDTIIMPNNSYLMIHNPGGLAVGTADDFRTLADLLEHMQAVAAQVYADRSGQTIEVVQAMMDAETYLDADQAFALGFADQVEQPLKIAASLDLTKLPAMPAQMRAALTKEIKMAEPAPNPPAPAPAAPPAKPAPPAPAPPHVGDGEPGALPADAPLAPVPTPPASPGYGADEALATMRACNTAGFPELAERLVAMRASAVDVQTDVDRAKGIKDIGQRTGKLHMTGPAIAGGVDLEVFRAMAFATAADAGPTISTAIPPGQQAAVEPIDPRAVFAKMSDQRRQAAAGRRVN